HRRDVRHTKAEGGERDGVQQEPPAADGLAQLALRHGGDVADGAGRPQGDRAGKFGCAERLGRCGVEGGHQCASWLLRVVMMSKSLTAMRASSSTRKGAAFCSLGTGTSRPTPLRRGEKPLASREVMARSRI